jgi:hypothetical protein
MIEDLYHPREVRNVDALRKEDLMRASHPPVVSSLLFLLMLGTSSARPSTDKPVLASGDMTGTWSCSLSHVRVSGICPGTPKQSGTCEIRKTEGKLTLVYASGFRCSPKAACSFSCREAGGTFTCENSGPADHGGGRYASRLVFSAGSARQASGTGSSLYEGPGMRCEWKTSIVFSRAATPQTTR